MKPGSTWIAAFGWALLSGALHAQPAVDVFLRVDAPVLRVGQSTTLRVMAQVAAPIRTDAAGIFTWHIDVLLDDGNVVRAAYDSLSAGVSDHNPATSSTGVTRDSNRLGIHDSLLKAFGSGVNEPVELLAIPVTASAQGAATFQVRAGTSVANLASDFLVSRAGGGDPFTGGNYAAAAATLVVEAVDVRLEVDDRLLTVGGTTSARVFARVQTDARAEVERIRAWALDLINDNGSVIQIVPGSVLMETSDNLAATSSSGTLSGTAIRGIRNTFETRPGAGVREEVQLFSCRLKAVGGGQAALRVVSGAASAGRTAEFTLAGEAAGEWLSAGKFTSQADASIAVRAVNVSVAVDDSALAVGGRTRLRVFAQVEPGAVDRAGQILSWYVDLLDLSGAVTTIDYATLTMGTSQNSPGTSSSGKTVGEARRGIHNTFAVQPGLGIATAVELFSVEVTANQLGTALFEIGAGTEVPEVRDDFVVSPKVGGASLIGGVYASAVAGFEVVDTSVPSELKPVRIQSFRQVPNGFEIRFRPEPNQLHTVQFRDALRQGPDWGPLPGAPHNSGVVLDSPSAVRRYYRIRITAP